MMQWFEMFNGSFMSQDFSTSSRLQPHGQSRRSVAVTCLNDAPYVQDPTTEHSFCDCAQIESEDSFVGARCEFVATTYCEGPSIVDPDSSLFCTNEGNCTVTDEDQGFEECVCPEEWRGQHCEYPMVPDIPPEMDSLHETVDVLTELENEQPRNNIMSTAAINEQEGGGAIIFISTVLISMLACVGILARFYVKRKESSHDRVAVWTQELQLDDEEDNFSLAETREVT